MRDYAMKNKIALHTQCIHFLYESRFFLFVESEMHPYSSGFFSVLFPQVSEGLHQEGVPFIRSGCGRKDEMLAVSLKSVLWHLGNINLFHIRKQDIYIFGSYFIAFLYAAFYEGELCYHSHPLTQSHSDNVGIDMLIEKHHGFSLFQRMPFVIEEWERLMVIDYLWAAFQLPYS